MRIGRLFVLLSALLFGAWASFGCSGPQPLEPAPGPLPKPAAPPPEQGTDATPFPGEEALWLALSGRADAALLTVKTGELLVRSAGRDPKKRDGGYRKMVFGMRRLAAALRDARSFFLRLRRHQQGIDLQTYEEKVASWAHDLLQASRLLPAKYAEMLREE
jgi:hypothetical protein